MSVWPTNVKDWAELAAYVVGILAVFLSVCQYFRNSVQERMRWLFELYDRFYGNVELRDLRVRIDMGDTSFAREEKDPKLMGQLDDFLNFFEFVGYLKERKQLQDSEVRSMFDYMLRKIGQDKNIAHYLGQDGYGYEKLPQLLKELGYAK